MHSNQQFKRQVLPIITRSVIARRTLFWGKRERQATLRGCITGIVLFMAVLLCEAGSVSVDYLNWMGVHREKIRPTVIPIKWTIAHMKLFSLSIFLTIDNFTVTGGNDRVRS